MTTVADLLNASHEVPRERFKLLTGIVDRFAQELDVASVSYAEMLPMLRAFVISTARQAGVDARLIAAAIDKDLERFPPTAAKKGQ